MAGMQDILMLAVVGGGLYYEFIVRKGADLQNLIPSAAGASSGGGGGGGSTSSGGGGKTAAPAKGGGGGGGKGGEKGTPGWYTLQGHHHCSVSPTGQFGAGCLCTDPKKCIGHAGTGAQYCAAHLEECWPVDKPNWCAYWYASDQKYCNLCTGTFKYTGPAGSGAKPCP